MWELFDVADEATLFNIGYCHQMLQDYNNASMFYGRCLSINPNSLCALINMRSLEMLRDCYEIDKPLNIRENSGDN
jgi:tetratricopeptide (TPR) repeat protein